MAPYNRVPGPQRLSYTHSGWHRTVRCVHQGLGHSSMFASRLQWDPVGAFHRSAQDHREYTDTTLHCWSIRTKVHLARYRSSHGPCRTRSRRPRSGLLPTRLATGIDIGMRVYPRRRCTLHCVGTADSRTFPSKQEPQRTTLQRFGKLARRFPVARTPRCNQNLLWRETCLRWSHPRYRRSEMSTQASTAAQYTMRRRTIRL